MARDTDSSGQPVNRVDWLDALRGWAILGVLLVHSSQNVTTLTGNWKAIADAGQYGVQLFFVVSALTIGLTYERQLTHKVTTGRATFAWLIKRYFRIGPLYYFGIALYLAVFTGMRMLGSQLPANGPFDILANVLFVHSWIPSAQNTVVPGGWSIGVEMCFYLVAPILFLTLRSARSSLLAFAAVIIVVVALNHGMAFIMTGHAAIENNSFLYFWFPTQLPVFLAGIALYRCAGTQLWKEKALHEDAAAFALIAALFFGVAGLMLGTVGDLDNSLAPTAMGIAFAGLALGCRTPVAATLLVNRATTWIGQISYSVYINHFVLVLALRFVEKRFNLMDVIPAPLLFMATFALVLGLSLPMSLLTRRMIEAPGIDIGHRLAAALEGRRHLFTRGPARGTEVRR
ncbi:MAG TPA: acyltransferase [Magnetospirillaceae bacterium]|jgi:peptidoglycan/LPS O-acetylase OafA/YrhL